MLFKNQNTFPKHKCFCQNALCFQSVGPVLHIGAKLSQGYIQKSFLVIGDYKKTWNHAKTIFLVHIQHCPPLFFPSSVFLVHAARSMSVHFHHVVGISINYNLRGENSINLEILNNTPPLTTSPGLS